MNIYVQNTEKKGKGIFAARNFKKGEKILTVRGKVYYATSARDAVLKGLNDNYLHQMGKKLFINNKTLTRYINHSCNPNALAVELSPHSYSWVAIKEIRKGKEITTDYDTYDSGLLGSFKCLCKCNNCRGIIKGYRYLPKKLKEKYRKFTSRYLIMGNLEN